MSEIDDLLNQALDVLETYGVSSYFFETEEGEDLIESVTILSKEREEAFCTAYEVSVFLLEGMTSVMKEKSLELNESGFHTTPDGRLITGVIASQDGLQEEALNIIQSAKGPIVLDIYHQVLQPLSLHCPTCSCETEICTYDRVIEKREEYLIKLKEVLGTKDE